MTMFTVEQANRMLPLVRRIVEDVVRYHRLRQEKVIELDLIASAPRPQDSVDHIAGLERRAQAVTRELEGFSRELADLGVRIKDHRLGLVDFPSEIDGREVLLCWRLGESEVQYWHELDAGFANRQLLVPSAVG